jgi:hypothetical protein
MGSSITKLNKLNKFDNPQVYRKITLDKITEFFNNNPRETCTRLQVKSKDAKQVIDLERYIKSHGFNCTYRWSWSAETGYSGELLISTEYIDKIRPNSFIRDTQCCRCFKPLFDNKTKSKSKNKFHTFKCKHRCHPQCRKIITDCPICQYAYLRRKSLKLENSLKQAINLPTT